MKCLKFPNKDCDLLTCHMKRKCLWYDDFAQEAMKKKTEACINPLVMESCEHEEILRQGDGFVYKVCGKCGADL